MMSQDVFDSNGLIWEQGSEFHLPAHTYSNTNHSPWEHRATYWASGRAALLAILGNGFNQLNWKRIWIPSYYCPDVVDGIEKSGLEIEVYSLNPDTLSVTVPLEIQPGDVVLLANIFGLFTKDIYQTFSQQAFTAVIEDHTHDPWSSWASESEADWCFASLRKTLPIPDGAVSWSPRDHSKINSLPIGPEHQTYTASLEKMTSMVLKGYYLRGGAIRKDVFRKLAVAGEHNIFQNELVSISPWSFELYQTFPIHEWRGKRVENWRILVEALKEESSIKILFPPENEIARPFSVILLFPSKQCRDKVRGELIQQHIYPSVLWDISSADFAKKDEKAIDFSKRMLSIHCDMRYNREDMLKVGQAILQAVRGCSAI